MTEPTPPTLQPVHTLEIPTQTLSLLIPSACIAEVCSVMPIKPLPHSPVWVLGVIGWRSRPVTVISVEALVSGAKTPRGVQSKIVILYPLPGRLVTDFFGIMASGEPQSHTIDNSMLDDNVNLAGNPLVAAAIRLERGVAGIPDFEAFKRMFYP